MVKCTLEITEKSFNNDKGEKIDYYDCVALIGNANVRFVPKTEDKSLLKHMLTKENGAK